MALGLVATAAGIGAAFCAFALILLPTLSFVGLVTFERVLQSGIEDHGYARRIARLRGYYFDAAPELTGYLLSVAPSERLSVQGPWARPALAAALPSGAATPARSPSKSCAERARCQAAAMEPHQQGQRVEKRIRGMRADGATMPEIAETLNREGVPTARGGPWYPSTVRRVLVRAA